MYKAKYLSPKIPSFDIQKTVSFFTDVLHFKIGRVNQMYVILYKDNCSLHLLQASSDIGEMEFYFEVDD